LNRTSTGTICIDALIEGAVMEIHDLSCTLSGPELIQRIQEWRRVAARAKSRTLESNAVVSTYPPDPALLSELRRLIEAEKECCSFMEFQINETSEDVIVHLRVPEEMKHVLALMVGLTTDEGELSAEIV